MDIRRATITLAIAACSAAIPVAAQNNGAAASGILWVEGNGVRLRASDGGVGGIPVVFVHSLAGDLTQWDQQLQHLRTSRRAVAFDFRGHGESSTAADGDYTLDAIATDIEAVADHLGLRRFVLVGHSLGGGAVAQFASAHPDRVAGLVFADPIGDQRAMSAQIDALLQALDGPSYQQTIESYWMLILTNARPAVVESVMSTMRGTDQTAVVATFREVLHFDPVGTLESYAGPMLSIVSEFNDFPFSMHNVVPGLPHERMTGTSHWLQLDRADEFNSHLDRFLERVR